jgi:ATP-dependent helicase Lhr and Lhr-like helicase
MPNSSPPSDFSAAAGQSGFVQGLFHPAIAAWLQQAFDRPTDAQLAAWPEIRAGRDVLIAAPTGSGKTLAAFLGALDDLVRRGLEEPLPDQTFVVYVSPLKALSNDIHKNLELPLQGINAELERQGHARLDIRTMVRTGDTPQGDRQSMRKRAPHIVITTPESLYVLLGSDSGRRMLASTRTVIVDEIHAVAGSKRGSHLALSLERLAALCEGRLQRIGLSATQNPIETVARFLVGARCAGSMAEPADCVIVDSGHQRHRDLQIELPPSPLQAVMSNDVWSEVYDRLAQLVENHRTTLIFVNTRRHAERIARHLSERLGKENVGAHHGSLSKERRFDAEQRLKSGQLRALVATASLELGIDIGDVNLVCQIGSCRSIAAFLQRAGRAGHSVGGTPKARLFPLSLDELNECAALLDAVRRGELDRLVIPELSLDVLAQQIVAEAAAQEWNEDALFELLRGAYPYRALERAQFDEIVQMLVEGFGTRRGESRQYLYRDAVEKRLLGRRGARLTALTSGGTIPDNADYNVVLEPEAIVVGTVNEDFAVESLAGDIFQLGNTSYRIVRVEAGRVRVEDARGQPPSIPFWLGEAPGRSDELSHAVARLREEIEACADLEAALCWLADDLGIDSAAARQLADYLWAAKAALGALPTRDTIIFERFFDETGGMQFVIHAPLGSRINRAWGLALRKRFCRKFDFELQAAATEDSIILSLSTSHSFPLEEVAHYLNSRSVRDVLIQALLDAPMFAARWRWNATVALAIPRFRGGRKTPPQLQRMFSEDLLADIFPDQIACGENRVGDREIPDHPLVAQTLKDCLEEAMDLDGLLRVLRRIESGEVRIVARDVIEPSPLALQVLAARPYSFLDDAPLEERRTQAVMARRWLDPNTAGDLGRLDPQAIERVREEAFPGADTADELHDALMWCGFITVAEAAARPAWSALLATLQRARRVALLTVEQAAGDALALWVAAERLPRFAALFSAARLEPSIAAPEPYASAPVARADAVLEIVRGRLQALGPVAAAHLAAAFAVETVEVEQALLRLEQEGFVLRGDFTTAGAAIESLDDDDDNIDPPADVQPRSREWCERSLLARIHRYTINRLRREIEPVTVQDFLRFLFDWQHVSETGRKEGSEALAGLLADLEGFEAPAGAWETEILPARLADYRPNWLDDLCLSGRAGWARLSRPKALDAGAKRAGPVRTTPIALLNRRNQALWASLADAAVKTAPADGAAEGETPPEFSSRATRAFEFLTAQGASFFDEIVDGAHLLPAEAEEALAELVAMGRVVSDSYAGIRALLIPQEKRKPFAGGKRRQRTALFGIQDAGRWSLVRTGNVDADAAIEHIARVLLRRYGVIFWRMLAREASWLPPWRDLLRVLRRLEARGEIRGGRFVAGISGEQFAMPDALAALREIRRKPHGEELVGISGVDPLNLVGILTPGTKVPALTGNRILYRAGVPVAALVANEVLWLQECEPRLQAEVKAALIDRTHLRVPLLAR